MSATVRIALYAVRRMRFAPLAWGIPLGLLCTMIVGVFPSLQSSPELDKLVESYPEAFKEAFGVTEASFRTVEGYLAAEVFNLIAPLAVAYFVIHALARAISGGEQRGVMDVLLSAPLRRRQVLLGWLAGTAAVLLGILAIVALICQASALAFGVELSAGDTAAAVLNLWPLSVFFGGVTLLLVGLSSRTLAVTGAATGLLVAMYFVEVLGKLSDTVAAVDGVSAFHYYGSAIEDGIDPAGFAGLVAAGLVLAAVGCVLFERRDVRA